MTTPPAQSHNQTVSRLIYLLHEHLIKRDNKGFVYVPRAGLVKAPNTWLEPDLFYVAAETPACADPTYPQYMSTADLVIEVMSAESEIYDRNTKADTYAALGVKELWLVDEASGIIEVRTLEGDRYGPGVVFESEDQLRSTVLKGFEFRVGSVFGT